MAINKDEQKKQAEVKRVEELITIAKSTGAAVLGLEQTLMAVKEKRVRVLVVDEDLHQAGGECPNCGFLAGDEEKICLLCGMALHPEPDVIEVASKRVLDQGAEIETLRSQEARQVLEPYGRIGALLRNTKKPLERDSANRQILSRNGEIDQDVLHDETVEESFPASDPPGHTA